MNTFDLIIIGGGAAGLMAAITASENNCKVLLLEKGPQVGRKILISGGGRCNVTNNKFSSIKDFLRNYPRGNKFLIGPMNQFNHLDLINWFENKGLKLKTEDDGRVFPQNDQSSSVIELLEKEALQNGTKILLNAKVTAIEKNNELFKVTTNNEVFQSGKILIACGGMSYSQTGSTGDAYKWAKNFAHTIIQPKASLTGLLTNQQWVKDLKGITIDNVELKLFQSNKPIAQESGALLFTHWGVSGPGVFKITSLATGSNYSADTYILKINFFPQTKTNFLEDTIKQIWTENPRRKVPNCLRAIKNSIIPQRLEEMIINKVFDEKAKNKTVSEISKKEFNQLIKELTSLEISIIGTRPSGEEIVTAGGVCLDEINSKTMESKIIEGLYWAGEVLDIDGFTGGYNLQAAWTTGWIAGNSI